MDIIMTKLKKNKLNKHDVLEILNTLEMINYTIQRELSEKSRQAWNLECAFIGMKNVLSRIRIEKENNNKC